MPDESTSLGQTYSAGAKVSGFNFIDNGDGQFEDRLYNEIKEVNERYLYILDSNHKYPVGYDELMMAMYIITLQMHTFTFPDINMNNNYQGVDWYLVMINSQNR